MEDTIMKFVKITTENFEELKKLQTAYKAEIGEDSPKTEEFQSLYQAIETEQIYFYGCICEERLVGCCSVCVTYSTFQYGKAGVFEDFYIAPAYRHQGIARQLAQFAFQTSGVGSLTVGCADCDLKMYQAIGFKIPLGNMLVFEN